MEQQFNKEKSSAVHDLEATSAGSTTARGTPTYSAEMQPSPIAPPDGGLQAWIHVVLLHIVFFNTWGISNSFGIFQQYYASNFLSGYSPSTISWIGSVQISGLSLLGPVAGRLCDGGYFRPLFFTGVLLQISAVMMTSLATNYWQVFLAQALCWALGNGLAFIPAMSTTSTYFAKNRPIAISLGASGAAMGGLVYPILVQRLLDRVGFAWTMRCMGFLMLATYIPCLVWYRPRTQVRVIGPFVDPTAFRDTSFVFFSLSFFFSYWGVYTAFFYIGTFASGTFGLRNPGELVAILNGAGVVGRILPGFIATHWTGLLNLLTILCFLSSLLVYLWTQITTVSGLYAWVAVNGLIAHAMQGMYPTISTVLTPDPSLTGTRSGMATFLVGIAVLTGPVISGALLGKGEGSYLYAQLFAGSSILVALLCIAVARVATGGWKFKVKV